MWVGLILISNCVHTIVRDCMVGSKHLGHWQLSRSHTLGYRCCSPVDVPIVIMLPSMSRIAFTRTTFFSSLGLATGPWWLTLELWTALKPEAGDEVDEKHSCLLALSLWTLLPNLAVATTTVRRLCMITSHCSYVFTCKRCVVFQWCYFSGSNTCTDMIL